MKTLLITITASRTYKITEEVSDDFNPVLAMHAEDSPDDVELSKIMGDHEKEMEHKYDQYLVDEIRELSPEDAGRTRHTHGAITLYPPGTTVEDHVKAKAGRRHPSKPAFTPEQMEWVKSMVIEGMHSGYTEAELGGGTQAFDHIAEKLLTDPLLNG